jgi:hypothetical protein
MQINKKYIFSIGAHAMHHNLLLSAQYTIDYLTILEIENLISYLFDTPCYIGFPNKIRDRKKYIKGIKSYLTLMGYNINEEIYSIDHYLSEKIETTNIGADDYLRVLPYKSFSNNGDIFCSSCEDPNNKKLKMAFSAYRQALLSVEPGGMILNYWRVLEAVTKINERYQLMEEIKQIELQVVKCFQPFKESGTKATLNLMSKYKNFVLNYVKRLLKSHQSHKNIIDYLYRKRRNPSAHANDDILEITHDISLTSLYQDTLLIKYLARCAIEKYWKKITINL